MFKFKNINPAEIQKINAINSRGGSKTLNAFGEEGGGESDLVMPHETYMIGLSSLKSVGDPQPESSGLRVIDAKDNSFNRIFDLHAAGGGDPEPQMLIDENYIKEYESAFRTIFDSGKEEEDYEVRSLRIPALHVDALWLHKETGPDVDLYVPVKSIGLFEENKLYDKESFFKILKGAAKDYDLNDENLGG